MFRVEAVTIAIVFLRTVQHRPQRAKHYGSRSIFSVILISVSKRLNT